MARAIDADAVKRRAWDIAEAWKDQGRDYEALLLESVVEQIVDTQSTITPPNEPLCQENKIIIVKCKECKYHKPIDYCEKHNDSGWYDNDFCSFGKKKIKENKYE